MKESEQLILNHELTCTAWERWEFCLLYTHFMHVGVKVFKEETARGSGIDKCHVVTQYTKLIPF